MFSHKVSHILSVFKLSTVNDYTTHFFVLQTPFEVTFCHPDVIALTTENCQLSPLCLVLGLPVHIGVRTNHFPENSVSK